MQFSLRRLPLGVPSRVIMQALELATNLILRPEPTTAAGRAVCREAGFVILGSLCWALPASALRVRFAQSAACLLGSLAILELAVGHCLIRLMPGRFVCVHKSEK